jgi:hypothetical protein
VGYIQSPIPHVAFLSNHIPELKALSDISGDLGQLSHLNSKYHISKVVCVYFELLKTKLHYEWCL